MKTQRLTGGFALMLTAFALAGALPGNSSAQGFPTKSIRLLYPYAAGSGPDILGRMFAADAAKTLGQPIVFENRPGASGRLGLQVMRDAPPDGYVLNLVNDGNTVSQPAQDPEFKFEPGRDYAPISILFEAPLVFLARPNLPFKDLKGFVAYAKANPGKINFAVASGASSQFLAERLVRTLDVDLTFIGMKGGAEAASATLGGHTDMFFSTTGMKPNVDSGKLLALASSGKERWKPFAGAPTFRESGVPVIYAASYHLIAAAGTPRDTVLALHRAFDAASRAPETVKRMEDLAYTPVTGMPPDEVTATIRSEINVWIPILRKPGGKAQ